MSKVSPIYINALLADAAYIDLPMESWNQIPIALISYLNA